jgi:hypothetical protein
LVGAVVGYGVKAVERPFRRLLRRAEPLLGGLDVAMTVDTDPARMAGSGLDFAVSFYFPAGFEPPEPPSSIDEWRRWARGLGGHDVDVTKVRITLQGVEADAAVLVGEPMIDHACSPLPPGVICTPEGLGGGGVTPRRYEVSLFSDRKPQVVYSDRDERPSSFVLSKGETEQIDLVVSAVEPGLHEWTCVLPLTVNGVRRDLVVDDEGQLFVTVGRTDQCSGRLWVDSEWI